MKKYFIGFILICLMGCNEEKKFEIVQEYIEQIRKGNTEYNKFFFSDPQKVDIFMVRPNNIKIQRLLSCAETLSYQVVKDKYGTIIEIIVLAKCKEVFYRENDTIGKIYFSFSPYPYRKKLTGVITNVVAFPSDWDK